MAKLWKQVIDKAIELMELSLQGKVCYLYGAKGVWLKNEAMVWDYINREKAYFSKYSTEELNQIVKNSVGKFAMDCSALTGLCTGDMQWSIGQINNCFKYNSLVAGPTASLLFTTFSGVGRHIGLDVGGTGHGQGLCMHIGWESTDANVAKGLAGIVFEPIANRPWERSGQSNFVDYAGVYSPYAPIADLWYRLHPNPSPTPTYDGWVGEVYGKALVAVYQNPTGATPLSVYPALACGNLFDVVGDYGNRWQIKVLKEGKKYTGYLDKQYCLRKTEERNGVTTSDLHLRTNPGTSKKCKSILIMPRGSVVSICDTKKSDEGTDWYYVIYKWQYGFASARYIK